MEKTKSISIADKLTAEICLETENYKKAIKSNRPFSEAKAIRAKIKSLVEEWSKLLAEHQN